ncbi:MAG: response regulator [Candidatus Tectomicrobia bacterium]
MLFVTLGWFIWSSYKDFKRIHTQDFRLQQLTGTITHLDEVLTMSARMAVAHHSSTASDSSRWEKRYRRFEPLLDTAIQDAKAIAPGAFISEAATQTDTANTKLVAMEHQAFDLVRSGKRDAAAALLFSQDYEGEKKRYSAGMQSIIATLAKRTQHALQEQHQRGLLAGISVVVALPFVLLVWLGTIRLIGAYDTKRKQAEDALQNAHDALERRVEERTAALTQTNEELKAEISERQKLAGQLRQSHKMEAIGTLAGGIAHDFNNILAILMNCLSLIEPEVPHESKALGYVQLSHDALQRAKNLVQQILAFSRQDDQVRTPVQMPRLLNETLALLRSSLPTTIDMQQHISEEDVTILGDATQMHQIMLNLCTNAAHAMRDTGGILEVRLETTRVDDALVAHHPALQPGLHAHVTVRDTGHGMAPDVLERIFDPFYTTKGVGEGTGMGLAMVHGIVVSHQGAITVESRVGTGTTFEMYLPIYLPRMETTTGTPRRAEESIPRGTGCILFVDDEVMLARLGQEMLERLGYEVVSRTSSIEALEAFRAMPHRFDAVITDQTMPNMTGEQLARELRSIRCDIPIILCTGFSHTMSTEQAQAAGIDAFCMKPVIGQDLAVIIQRVIGQRSQPKTHAGARILLIDDDAPLRSTLHQLLEEAGYEVIDASDGDQGIQRYRETPTDLVITDLLMPHKEGLETIQELRREFPAVKIVAISGGGKAGNLDFLPAAQQFGAQRFLRKPFEQDELLGTIEEILQA